MLRAAKKEYERRIKAYKELLDKQTKRVNTTSILRLFIFVIGIAITGVLIYLKYPYLSISSFLVTMVIFTLLVIQHRKFKDNKRYTETFIKINEASVQRTEGQWKEFEDSGEEFQDENHSFSGDLDIFGRGSLFQWINSAVTPLGRIRLRDRLTDFKDSIEEKYKTQEAVKELSSALGFRQKYIAEALMEKDNMRDPGALFKWAGEKHEFYKTSWLNIVTKIMPLLPIGALFALILVPGFTYKLLLLAILINILFLMPTAAERQRILDEVAQYKKSLNSYYKMVRLIENKKFKAEHLNELKKKLTDSNGVKASKQLEELQKIISLISDRANMFYIIVNIFFVLDYKIMIRLEKWKESNGKYIETWLSIIGEFEALSSISVIGYENPTWVMPEFLKDIEKVSAKGMGHPLLGEKRVSNNFIMEKPAKVLLITGSNMSGKSTLLRTIGINLVLSYAGAPVCAESFKCPVMKIYTCMRVSDNLEKNISSFYAELIRIRAIVEASKEEGKIFFLLDEIFKGTNSMDRHEGARVLITQLSKAGAMGLVSTHDLELGDLENESGGRIKNYHFREYYEDDKIKFDYKLRQGVSTTRNALYLIKLAGIEVDASKKA
jgi:DNA mismatch repair ATPase MutS